MSNTSMPAVVDKLVALATAACTGATVTDGAPGGLEGPAIVSVGSSVVPTEEGTQTPAELGQRSIYEDYRVAGIVTCTGGGPDQKPTRDAAFVLYNQLVNAIRADWTLGGLVMWAYVEQLHLIQTNNAAAGGGRVAEISFAIRCYARI